MMWRRLHAPLPLLGKELVEQAARRRTYVVRMVGGALLFLFFLVFLHAQLREWGSSGVYDVAQLGHGRDLFQVLVWSLLVGVLLFLPAMMSGALTYEKERRSMELLLLTGLRPWAILLQKYVGRLIPMLTILLLALPLLAVCYTFGGMTTEFLFAGAYVLVLTCLQAGALALLCSAWCRTSLGAFLSAYVVCMAWYLLPPLYIGIAGSHVSYDDPGLLVTAFMPELIFIRATVWYIMAGAPMGVGPGPPVVGALVEQSLGVWASILLLLLLARAFLLRRAFLEPRNLLLVVFGTVDRFFAAVNRVFGDVQVLRDRGSLPEDKPVAWRETTKRSLGKARYLFRILLVLEVPVLFLCLGLVVREPSVYDTMWVHSVVLWTMWLLAALAVTVVSANTIVAERASQTLEVLATTPLAGRDIVRQKMRGIRRLIVVLAVPLATLHVFGAWWQEATGYEYGAYRGVSQGLYLAASGLAIGVYLPMLSWFALWISLRSRTRFRAIVRAVATLAVWAIGPWLIFLLFEIGRGWTLNRRGTDILLLASPATMLVVCEYGGFDLFDSGPLMPIVLNYGAYGFLLWVFRALCLRNADGYLGRAQPREAWPEPPPEGPG